MLRFENLSKMAKNGDGIEEQFDIEEINIISEKDLKSIKLSPPKKRKELFLKEDNVNLQNCWYQNYVL